MCTSHSSLQLYFLRKMLFLVFFLSIFLGVSQAVWAATWSVSSSYTSTTCNATDLKCPTIADAIAGAAAITGADTINVAAGVYTESNLAIGEESLTIRGAGAGSTIIQANSSQPSTSSTGNKRVFLVQTTNVKIQDVSIQYGKYRSSSANQATDSGGGVRVGVSTPNTASLTLSNCIILSNISGYQGGGVKTAANGSIAISNCTIYGNTSNGSASSPAIPEISGSGLASGSTGPDCHGTITTSSNVIIQDISGCTTSALPNVPVNGAANVANFSLSFSGTGTGKVTAVPSAAGATLVCTNSVTGLPACTTICKLNDTATLTATDDSG